MEGKQYFIECCKELGIDSDKYIKIGKQAGQKNRLVYKSEYTSRKSTQLYAVCYYKNEDLYVAWSLKEKKPNTYNYFSVKKDDVIETPQNEILHVQKAIEYSGWDEEVVYSFRRSAVKLFLETHVIVDIESSLKD